MNMKVQPMPGRYLAMSFIMALVPWCVCVCVCVCVYVCVCVCVQNLGQGVP